jgi:hypothetical protein
MRVSEKLLGVGFVFVVVAAISARAFSDDQEEQAPATKPAVADRTVVTVQGDSPAKVKVGDIVRVKGSGPSGMVDISVKTDGPVKLVATNNVREIVKGHAKIGVMVKEFEVKATDKGQAKVMITITNRIQKTTESKEFNIEVE